MEDQSRKSSNGQGGQQKSGDGSRPPATLATPATPAHNPGAHPPDQSGYLAPAIARHEGQSKRAIVLKVLAALAMTYCFLMAINMMGDGIKYTADIPEYKQKLSDDALRTPADQFESSAVGADELDNPQDLIGRLVATPSGVTTTEGYVAIGDKLVQARTEGSQTDPNKGPQIEKSKNARIVQVRQDVLIVEAVHQYRDWLYSVFHYAQNPFIGLLVGILITAVFQSSSFTTSLTVGLVASVGMPEAAGAEGFGLAQAIPVIMGANIGTSITNCLVSLGFVNRRDEFRRAFACATVHDFFNLLTVAVLFTLEMTTHMLSWLAIHIVELFYGAGQLQREAASGGASGLGLILKPVVTAIRQMLESLDLGRNFVGITLTVIAAVVLFASLLMLVRILRSLVLKRMESFFDRVLFRNAAIAFIVGLVITAAVQSSSVTTSLAVPLAAAGLLTLNQVFPYLLGANIGTTFTALLAAFATVEPRIGLTLALVHLLFNVIGAMIFYPLRWIPIGMARGLATRAADSRYYAILFIMIVFFGLPLLGLGIYMLFFE